LLGILCDLIRGDYPLSLPVAVSYLDKPQPRVEGAPRICSPSLHPRYHTHAMNAF
jgi:hypothetical protein